MFSIFKRGLKTAELTKKQREKIDKDELEGILLEADVAYEVVERILEELPEKGIRREQLKNSLILLFNIEPFEIKEHKPFVDLIIGVNGAGKTTTIAKLATNYKKEGKSVLLGAGDTFRAAAIEQLTIWSERVGVGIIKTSQGHDASAVAFDTISAAIARGIDRVIIDTAGRLQTQTNLANELKKIVKVCDKALIGAPHRKILILDGTQGNAAIAQAKAFDAMVEINGIIITKLDGTAKGGSVLSIVSELRMPIFYIGVGEGADDLVQFNAMNFINSLLDGFYAGE